MSFPHIRPVTRTTALAALAVLGHCASFVRAQTAPLTAPLVIPTDDDYHSCGDWCAVSIIFIILFGSCGICLCLLGMFALMARSEKKKRAMGVVSTSRFGRRRNRSPVGLGGATPMMRSASPAPLIVQSPPPMIVPHQPGPVLTQLQPQFVSMGPPQMEQYYDAYGAPLMRV